MMEKEVVHQLTRMFHELLSRDCVFHCRLQIVDLGMPKTKQETQSVEFKQKLVYHPVHSLQHALLQSEI
jgi:hypothetical protein